MTLSHCNFIQNRVIRFHRSLTWQPGRRFCTFGCAQLAGRARNFAPIFSGRTNGSGNGSFPRRLRGTAHRLRQQAETTNAQTSNNWTGPSPSTRRRVAQAPKTAVWSFQGAEWQLWHPVPCWCRLKTPSTGRSLCGTGFFLDSHFHSHPNAGRALAAPLAFHPGAVWLELQKVQHSIQSAFNKRRDSGRPSGSHTHPPTAMLEQLQERLHSIAQDMYILNRSCAEEIVRSSLVRARRNWSRRVKQACSDTIEESISSTDEVAPKEGALGSTKDHHPAPPHTSRGV